MTDGAQHKLDTLLSAERMRELNEWIEKYPADERQSAVMRALMLVQEQHNHLRPELMDAVADYLRMPHIAVYEVASFYNMYQHAPVGRNMVNVCTSISCKLMGSDETVDYIEQHLNIKAGETTEDGRYTLRRVECLGACVNAPMMQVNKDYHENLTHEKIDLVLEQYK